MSEMQQKIQYLRALAIIAVVAIHTPAPEPYVIYIRPFLNFAVALFLFLSAYLTMLGTKNNDKFDYSAMIKKRLQRNVPTYAIWVVLASLFALIPSFSIRNFLVTLFWNAWGAPYYFFLVYFQLTLLFPAIVWLNKSKYHIAAWLITPLALVFHYILQINNIKLPGMGLAVLCPLWFACYYLGIVLGQREQVYTKKLSVPIFIWLLSIIMQLMEGWFWYQNNNFGMATTQLKITSVVSSLCACYAAYAFINHEMLSTYNRWYYQVLLLIGNCSMGIFLCHMPILILCRQVIYRLPFDIPYPTLTIATITGSVLLILAANKLLPMDCLRLLGFDYSSTKKKN